MQLQTGLALWAPDVGLHNGHSASLLHLRACQTRTTLLK